MLGLSTNFKTFIEFLSESQSISKVDLDWLSDKLYALNKLAKQYRGKLIQNDEDFYFDDKNKNIRNTLYGIKNEILNKYGTPTGESHKFPRGFGVELTINGNDSFHLYFRYKSDFLKYKNEKILNSLGIRDYQKINKNIQNVIPNTQNFNSIAFKYKNNNLEFIFSNRDEEITATLIGVKKYITEYNQLKKSFIETTKKKINYFIPSEIFKEDRKYNSMNTKDLLNVDIIHQRFIEYSNDVIKRLEQQKDRTKKNKQQEIIQTIEGLQYIFSNEFQTELHKIINTLQDLYLIINDLNVLSVQLDGFFTNKGINQIGEMKNIDTISSENTRGIMLNVEDLKQLYFIAYNTNPTDEVLQRLSDAL